eukprot:37330_1
MASNHINWDKIQYILEANGFMTDPSEVRDGVQCMEQYCEDQHIDKDTLILSLCDGYGYPNDAKNPLYELLANQLKYRRSKRSKLYNMLLHQYITLRELDTTHLLTILRRNVRKINPNINVNQLDQIIRMKQFDGARFESIGSTSFALLFDSMEVDAAIWKRIYKKEIKKWIHIAPMRPREVKQEEEEEEEVKQQDSSSTDHADTAAERSRLLSFEHKEQEVEPNQIPRLYKDTTQRHHKSDFPFYILKAIWSKSDDEHLELLVDGTISKILNLKCRIHGEDDPDCMRSMECKPIWEDVELTSLIYNDSTFCEFVDHVYTSCGGNTFFDEFIKLQFSNQMRHFEFQVQTEIKRVLKTNDEIYDELLKMRFEDFLCGAHRNNEYLTMDMFVEGFKYRALRVKQKQLKAIYNDMLRINRMDRNGTDRIYREDFRKWKESIRLENRRLQSGGHGDMNRRKKAWRVYYDYKEENYSFYRSNSAASPNNAILLDANICDDVDYKWSMFVPRIPKHVKIQFEHHHNEIPSGYWMGLKQDTDATHVNAYDRGIRSYVSEQIAIKHLNLIFELLHHYYLRNMDNANRSKSDININDPLQAYVQEIELRKADGADIIFKIKGNEYQLKWWNKRGKYETTALSLINITKWRAKTRHKASDKRRRRRSLSHARKKEICYMRFNALPSKVTWQWFDKDTSEYTPYDYTDTDLLEQLECSFLGNVKINFDPLIFDTHFNHCLLPLLRDNLKRQNIRCSDAFVFIAHHEDNGIITSMEQISYKHHVQSHFERTIQRLIDGTDSLSIYWRDENLFIQRLKKNLQLYSEPQQKFYFAFMTAIAIKIKYIDVEFANQPVLLPLHFRSASQHNIVKSAIDDSSIFAERFTYHYFEGHVIPPSDMVSCGANRSCKAKVVHKSKILQKAKARNTPHNTYMWVHSGKDNGKRQFTKEEADFLRFSECIRKYVLEYESGDAVTKLWPWYRNSFHSVLGYDDADTYNDLIFKYDYLSSWDIPQLLQKLHRYNKEQRARNKRKRQREWTLSNRTIRFKRKFAAQLLLDQAETERNLNLLRAQLTPLLDHILQNVIFDHRLICNCNLQQMLHILNHSVLETLNSKKDNKCILYHQYHDRVLNYFTVHQLHGNAFCKLNKMEFVLNFMQFIGDTKEGELEEEISILHDILSNYKSNKEEQASYLNKNDEEKQRYIVEYVTHFVMENQTFWATQIETVNARFESKLKPYSKYQLLDEILHTNLDHLNICRFKLPLFEQFVYFFFIQSDKTQYEVNTSDFNGEKLSYYPYFLESWRAQVPKWYLYSHDVLLLELALRHGVGRNCNAFIDDLNGDKQIEYKTRMQYNARNSDRFYCFKTWVANECNVLHRLKYVLRHVVKNLEDPNLGGALSLNKVRIPQEEDRPTFFINSAIFSDYQARVHREFIERSKKMLRFDYDDKNQLDRLESILPPAKCGTNCLNCGCCGCNCNHDGVTSASVATPKYRQLNAIQPYSSDTDTDNNNSGDTTAISLNHLGETSPMLYTNTWSEFPLIRKLTTGKSSQRTIRVNDPFVKRNINRELCETLQSFDLHHYGVPLALFIVDQFKKQKKESYWKILAVLMHALPYPVALNALKDPSAIGTLRHGEPDRLRTVCMSLVSGSSFKPSAALAVAEFFDELSLDDIVLEDVWQGYSNVFEQIAYEEINKVESNHLLFTLLSIPLATHKNYGLVQLALEHKRIEFLNNDRINRVIDHVYRQGFLAPDEEIETGRQSFADIFKLVLCHPFQWYYSSQGYHWISGELFLMYWCFACYYSYQRTQTIAQESYVMDYTGLIFWICNIGYILFEVFEAFEKGLTGYFDFSSKGQANVLDFLICLIWLVLLPLRIYMSFLMFHGRYNFAFGSAADVRWWHKIYLFLFSIQLVMLTIRCLTLFSNSVYLGTLLRVIKLMFIEIFKFSMIFCIVLIGVTFGLWISMIANHCYIISKQDTDITNDDDDFHCDDFEFYNLGQLFLYMFEVFDGTAGIAGGLHSQPYAVIFMIGATFMGSLVLTNLLIALMTNSYENVKQKAKAEVIFNQTELTFDLSKRSRSMPPPLNVISLALTLVVHFINLLFAVFKPKSLNVYVWMDHRLFDNLKRCNLFDCRCKHWRTLKKPAKFKYESSLNVLHMYFISPITNLLVCDGNLNYNKQRPELQHLKDWKIHHKPCYGVMIMSRRLDPQQPEKYALRGITMSQLMEQYTQQNIDRKDKALLKRLTTKNLFCAYCYRPYLPEELHSELITPFMALLDLMSAVTFILVPVAWIPLISLFGFFAFLQCIGGWCSTKRDDSNYLNLDFDREIPNQFNLVEL